MRSLQGSHTHLVWRVYPSTTTQFSTIVRQRATLRRWTSRLICTMTQ